jgi:hypothetical protein
MPKLVLRCFCEIAGVDHSPGDEIEVDDANAVRMIRKGMAVKAAKPKPASKKKAKASASEE